ncbi:MAG: hypothetical protein SCH71_09755 [Desulfobulbaceae bacterium]|nr:hypothetical protein [Desulfobulbaceae bacterium]
MISTTLLEAIENEMSSLEVDFHDDDWIQTIPSLPGWYFFETDTPPEEFCELGPPVGINHNNLPKKVDESSSLRREGILILPAEYELYFVYSGETANLKARIKEHIWGHEKTYCLALSNYLILHDYSWVVHWATCSFGEKPNDSKLWRIFGEQAWRAKNGWPILCGR